MTGLRFTVEMPAPFSFQRTVDGAQFYSVLGRAMPDGAYRRILRVGSVLALIEFSGVPLGVAVRLLMANGPVDPAVFEARARWMLHPELDLTGFYAMAQADPTLAPLVKSLDGLRAFRLDSVFESLVITIIEQQIALTMAQTAERWLIGQYGERLTFEGETWYAFPRPETLAALEVSDLTQLKITFLRMGRLLDIARAVASGALDLETLTGAPDALYARLLSLHGVGHWTACWAMIRAIGQFRYFGRADVALRAVANQYFEGRPGRMDGAVMDAHFARYGDDAGHVAFYLIMRYAHDKAAL